MEGELAEYHKAIGDKSIIVGVKVKHGGQTFELGRAATTSPSSACGGSTIALGVKVSLVCQSVCQWSVAGLSKVCRQSVGLLVTLSYHISIDIWYITW
jgi:hypothetical protein